MFRSLDTHPQSTSINLKGSPSPGARVSLVNHLLVRGKEGVDLPRTILVDQMEKFMAQVYETWVATVQDSYQEFFTRILNAIPNLVGALIVIVLGWIVADLLQLGVDRLLRAAGVQQLFDRARVEAVVKRAKTGTDTTGLIAALVKWIVLLVAFVSAANILGLSAVADFLRDAVNFATVNVAGAAAILLTGAIFANWFGRVVYGSVAAAKLSNAEVASNVARYSILVFAALAALNRLGVAPGLIQTLFTGFVALVAIAGGLAFGLGGQKAASEWVEKWRRDLNLK